MRPDGVQDATILIQSDLAITITLLKRFNPIKSHILEAT